MQSGLDAGEIERIKVGAGADGWSAAEKALLIAVDDLNREHFVSNVAWTNLAKHYSERQCMDLVFTVGAYDLLALAMRSFGVELDDDLIRK